jgi:hypothetical protein
MNRRQFLTALSLTTPTLASAQQGPPVPARVEGLTAPAKPAIALNHLGFLPAAKKTVIYRDASGAAPSEFTLRDIGFDQWRQTRPLKKMESDFGPVLAGDFSDVERAGMYQVTVGKERSVPFFIRTDTWRRTLPKAVGYYSAQRCGTAVPNVHPECHLDDARRRDNGVHVDTTGGWHDAGDLRKWIGVTMLNGVALLSLARNLGSRWNEDGSGIAPLLEEVRWGNRYFLKMQDADGQVWNDVAGGVNGDNSDNRWTDNRIGTRDDRYINTRKSSGNQAIFIMLQSMMAQAFRERDFTYSQHCLAAARRCWDRAGRSATALNQSWWVLAAIELFRATGDKIYAGAAVEYGQQLLSLQAAEYTGAQKTVRGFWRTSDNDSAPYNDAVYSAFPPLAMLELATAFPNHPRRQLWLDAVRLHLNDYVVPMTARSAYRIMPFGIFVGSPTQERYRPLDGELTYRYFHPVKKQFWWLGMTSHLECYGLLLARAAQTHRAPDYRDLAYRQFEWVMGANPFGACLMTGEGMRNPYPHSRFVGLIIGGIMNGIAGNADDEPVLDMEYGFDWRTTEYWSPHNAFYIWAHSVLEQA